MKQAGKKRAVDKIKVFILETKDTARVMPAIYRYKSAVIFLQVGIAWNSDYACV